MTDLEKLKEDLEKYLYDKTGVWFNVYPELDMVDFHVAVELKMKRSSCVRSIDTLTENKAKIDTQFAVNVITRDLEDILPKLQRILPSN